MYAVPFCLWRQGTNMGNEFKIFYSGGNDALQAVWHYRDVAESHAAQTGKTVTTREIDIDHASEEEKEHWNKSETIECVTVVDGVRQRGEINPPDDVIRSMIDALPNADEEE